MKELSLNLSDDVLVLLPEMVELRRHFHRYPELSNREEKTRDFIFGKLSEYGVDARPLGATGVLATVESGAPGDVLLLRADTDALPIQEACDIFYKSENQGVMHACGHDAHAAMLLGVAKLLKIRGISKGSVKLLFQPAEEGGHGARQMIDAGVLDNPKPDLALAFHVWSAYPIGEVAVLDGPVMASVDGFKMIVLGAGTHAATPEDGIDPILINAQILTAAQSLITRRKAAFEPAVLSFTAVNGGSAFNIIPERVETRGTIRAFCPKVRDTVRRELVELATGISEAMKGSVSFDFFESLGPTINDVGVASTLRKLSNQVVGEKRTLNPKPLMVGEDMGLILEKVPGALILLGCRNEDSGATYPHHHPKFQIDERVLAVGVQLALGFVNTRLL